MIHRPTWQESKSDVCVHSRRAFPALHCAGKQSAAGMNHDRAWRAVEPELNGNRNGFTTIFPRVGGLRHRFRGHSAVIRQLSASLGGRCAEGRKCERESVAVPYR